MQYIYSDSFGGTYAIALPFDSRGDSAKQNTAKAYRRYVLHAAGWDAVPTLLRVGGDSEELAVAA